MILLPCQLIFFSNEYGKHGEPLLIYKRSIIWVLLHCWLNWNFPGEWRSRYISVANTSAKVPQSLPPANICEGQCQAWLCNHHQAYTVWCFVSCPADGYMLPLTSIWLGAVPTELQSWARDYDHCACNICTNFSDSTAKANVFTSPTCALRTCLNESCLELCCRNFLSCIYGVVCHAILWLEDVFLRFII